MKKLVFALLFLLPISCFKDNIDPVYRQYMREFVVGISEYAKCRDSSFLIIPQNGIELVSENGEEDGPPSIQYLQAIDGNGQEDLFYGYRRDDRETPGNESDYLICFLDISKASGKVILVTDYCSSHDNMNDSYQRNESKGYISYAADSRELDDIPSYPSSPHNSNSNDITAISQVKNFLYLINPGNYSSKELFLRDIEETNYDLILIDLFFDEETSYTPEEVTRLSIKKNGGSRLVICYMSIGEAEDYRYYWESSWNTDKPEWLDRENPDWEGNYKVKYWMPDWQSIIFGNDNSYTKKILDAGFDGVYLDIIDAFEYYE
jgi:cysteinyl-tRNA synthetase